MPVKTKTKRHAGDTRAHVTRLEPHLQQLEKLEEGGTLFGSPLKIRRVLNSMVRPPQGVMEAAATGSMLHDAFQAPRGFEGDLSGEGAAGIIPPPRQ